MQKELTICYFGIYDAEYCRNKNIIKGLKKNGVKIIEIKDTTPGIKKFWKLFLKHWLVRKKYDLLIVGFPGQLIVPFVKLFVKKKIIFDAHLSFYDSLINNWKTSKKYSVKALWYFFLDWFSCRLADKILLDTREHVDYFVKQFRIRRKKFFVVYHGCDNELFYPLQSENKNDKFIVEFHGYITHLHGIKYVLEAMKLLEQENILLWIIGGSKEYRNMEQYARYLKLKNVIFFKPMPPKKLIKFIKDADIGIGILGDTDKVEKVIPNKLYELMAMKIPVVSADTPAVREQFKHLSNIYLCKKANKEAIACAFMELKNNNMLRKDLAENAYKHINQELVPKVLGKKLLVEINKI